MFEYQKYGESTDKIAEMALKDCDKEEEEEICEMWKIYAENDIMCLYLLCPDEFRYQEKVTDEEAEMALEDCDEYCDEYCEIDQLKSESQYYRDITRGEYIEMRMFEYEEYEESDEYDSMHDYHEAEYLQNEAVKEMFVESLGVK